MRFSETIIRLIDLFYVRPVAALLPRQVFRYAACGGFTYLLFDPLCYALFYNVLIGRRFFDLGVVVVSPHIAAMVLVFPFTFFVGFWLNRHVAFRLKFFVEVCGIWPTPAKVITTLVVTAYSFLAAKYFTFRHAARE